MGIKTKTAIYGGCLSVIFLLAAWDIGFFSSTTEGIQTVAIIMLVLIVLPTVLTKD